MNIFLAPKIELHWLIKRQDRMTDELYTDQWILDNYTNSRAYVTGKNSNGIDHVLLVMEKQIDDNGNLLPHCHLSIPGGKKETYDADHVDTAIRELNEEISDGGLIPFIGAEVIHEKTVPIIFGTVNKVPTAVEFFRLENYTVDSEFHEIINGDSKGYIFIPRLLLLNAARKGLGSIFVNGKKYRLRGPTIGTFRTMFEKKLI